MENQRSLQEPLLPSHNSSLGHQQKDVTKRKKLRRSRSAPIIVCIPRDIHSNEPVPTPEPRFPKLHPSVRRVTAFLTIYLGIGAICFYMVTDQLSGKKTTPIVDALYFCVVTMTTVGYGDLVPRTALAKLLACAFVFSGMALIVLVLSKAADYLVEKQEGLIKSARRMRRKFRPDDILKEIETKKVKHKCVVTSIVLFLLQVTGILFLIFVEKLDFLDAFYCVCVTMTSLGYGDNSFSTKRGRIFAVLWILTSTICVAQLFLYLAELNTERRQNDLIKWVLSRRVTIVDLEDADIDHDGVVNAAEFVLYKLKQMRKISQDDVLRVLKEFEELDVNQAGSLSIFDLTFAD
ncbi:two-pore potassium channel 1-like [Silene latifolia]|uniref:two-pore potassium channel 1-like n=1 Tax=Silene latifolia TaxID=37657 RepID=UPI003D76F6C1